MVNQSRPHVVIVGGGFGGLTAAKTLKRQNVQITLIDRTNHHLFQPLLYQVAIAGLSPGDIAAPIRTVFRGQKNTKVVLEEVTAVDLSSQIVRTRSTEYHYDFLILSTGGRTSYFGHDEWRKNAPGLKDLDDAVEIRNRVLLAFEAAEKETDAEKRRALLTFVVVGGGATGVEIAGSIAELARFVLSRDFRSIDSQEANIVLVEGGSSILPAFDPELGLAAVSQLAELGVKVHVDAKVTNITTEGVYFGNELIPASTVVWAAGVEATSLTRKLGVELDRAGRVKVLPDLTILGHPNAFAVGDMVVYPYQTGKPLPGVSPVAMQMGRAAAKNIVRAMKGEPYEDFHYFDKGSMATIGRSRAIAQIGGVKLSGWIAWMAWLVIHIFFLIGFRNRAVVLFNWAWSYFTYQRGTRLITGHRLEIPSAAEREVVGAPRDEYLVP